MINLGAASSFLHFGIGGSADALASATRNATSALSGFTRKGIVPAGAALGVFAAVQLWQATNAAQRFEDNLVRLSKVAGRDWGQPIARQIRNMSKELPIAADALFDVAESAVRLGVRGAANISHFVETMGKVGIVTDMSAQDAAENFARLATVMNVPISQIDKLAATANELSDSMATSFSEVVRTSGELAPVLIQMGVLPEQVFAFAAAQNEVNVSVQRGAQRLRSFVQQLQETNREASIANAIGLTAPAFREMLQSDPTSVIIQVAEAMKDGGRSARQLQETFDSAASLGVQALSQNLRGLNVALFTAKREMEEGGSLARQFGEFAASASSRNDLLRNRIEALRSEIGENLLPMRVGIVNFFSSLVSGIDSARRSLDAMPDLKDKFPEEVVDRLVDVGAEAIRRQNQQGLDRLESGDLAGLGGFGLARMAVENRIKQMAAHSLRDSGLVEFFDELYALIDDADLQTRMFNVSLEQVFEPFLRGELAIGDARRKLSEFTSQILNYAKNRDRVSAFDEDVTEVVERLRGMNLEFAKSVLAERFGVALSQVDDNVARMLLSLRQSEIAFHEGDRAAREFDLTLQNVPKSMRALILSAEENLKIQEMLRDSTNEYDSILEELTQRQRDLTETEEDAFKRRLDGIKFLMPWQRQLLQLAYDTTAAKEREADALNQYTGIVDDLTGRINNLETTERQRIRTRIKGLGLGEEEIKQVDVLLDRLEELEDMRAKQDELDRMRRRLDVTSLENRFRMLDQTISGVADNVIDLFGILNDENRKFGQAMQQTFQQIARDFARMFLRMQMMRALEGTDWFQNFVGLGSRSGGGSNAVSGMISSATGAASSQSASSAATTMAVSVNYTINSLDPRSVTDILNQQAPVIAANVARQFNRSAYLREQSNA